MKGGFSHVGLATRDMDGTIKFYQDTLGFKIVRYDEIGIEEGGRVRHVFLECGDKQMISFLGPENVPGFKEWDTAIYPALEVPRGFYHFAFSVDSRQALLDRRTSLEAKGIKVWQMNHEWCESIYFDDPINGLALEFCTHLRDFNEDDRTLSRRFTASVAVFTHDLEAKAAAEADRFVVLESRDKVSKQ